MPRFLRNISLVLSALCVFSAKSFSLNYTTMTSGLSTQSTVVNSPFSDGSVIQMPSASAPSFQNSNRLLSRRVSARGSVYTPNTLASASAGSPISRRSYRVNSVGGSSNSRSGATGSYGGGVRRGSDLTAGGASVRLGVANVSRTVAAAAEESTTTTTTPSTPDNGLGINPNDRRPGELTPIGDGLYPLLILLLCYALYLLLKGERKDSAKKEHQKK